MKMYIRIILSAGVSFLLLAAFSSCGKTDIENGKANKDAVTAISSSESDSSADDTSHEAAEAAVTFADSSSAVSSSAEKKKPSESTESEEDSSSEPEEPLYVIETHGPRAYDGAAEYDDFADTLFIGDSRTVGLMLNGNKPAADYFAAAGLNVITVQETPVVPRSDFAAELAAQQTVVNVSQTDDTESSDETAAEDSDYMLVPEALGLRKYNRIFLNFGINEMGWPYPETFVEKYELLISQIRAAQPTANIYIESMLPVSYQALEINSCFNAADVDAFNEDYIRRVALETGCIYMDVNRFFRDSRGDLYYGAAGDGIHLNRDWVLEWMDVLAYYTTGRGNLSEISYNITHQQTVASQPVQTDDGLPQQIIPEILPEQIIPDLSSLSEEQPPEPMEAADSSSETNSFDDTEIVLDDGGYSDDRGYGYDYGYEYGYEYGQTEGQEFWEDQGFY